MLSRFVHECGRKPEINHSYLMHCVLIIFIISNKNIVEFHVVVDVATLMDSFYYIYYFNAELVNSLLAEIHVELVKISIEITAEFLHDIKRHKLFPVFNAFLD